MQLIRISLMSFCNDLQYIIVFQTPSSLIVLYSYFAADRKARVKRCVNSTHQSERCFGDCHLLCVQVSHRAVGRWSPGLAFMVTIKTAAGFVFVEQRGPDDGTRPFGDGTSRASHARLGRC